MNIAKASAADLEVGLELVTAFDSMTSHWFPAVPMPCAQGSADGFEPLDLDDAQQCRRVLEYLIGVAGRGSLARVVYGMASLCHPENRVLDPASDVLELHPDLVALVNKAGADVVNEPKENER